MAIHVDRHCIFITHEKKMNESETKERHQNEQKSTTKKKKKKSLSQMIHKTHCIDAI